MKVLLCIGVLLAPAVVMPAASNRGKRPAQPEGPRGADVRGVVLQAPPTVTVSLREGGPMVLPLTIRNGSTEERGLWSTFDLQDWRVLVYDSAGNQLPFTELFHRLNPAEGIPGPRGVHKLPPGTSRECRLKLSKFVKLERPGTYRVVILRRTLGRWHREVASSNLTELNVTE